LMIGEVERAAALFDTGALLVARMSRELRIDVQLFIDGGRAILEAIRKIDYNVWRRRPIVSKWKKFNLLIGAWRESRRFGQLESKPWAR
jgi:hypothetical protein